MPQTMSVFRRLSCAKLQRDPRAGGAGYTRLLAKRYDEQKKERNRP